MLDAATETETETESEVEDEFTPLFAITQRRRARLFRDGNLNLLARLKVANRARYEKLLDRENGGEKVDHGSGGIVPLRAA